jgi:hypothetical protein
VATALLTLLTSPAGVTTTTTPTIDLAAVDAKLAHSLKRFKSGLHMDCAYPNRVEWWRSLDSEGLAKVAQSNSDALKQGVRECLGLGELVAQDERHMHIAVVRRWMAMRDGEPLPPLPPRHAPPPPISPPTGDDGRGSHVGHRQQRSQPGGTTARAWRYVHAESYLLLSHAVRQQLVVFVDSSAPTFHSEVLPALDAAAAKFAPHGLHAGDAQSLVVYIEAQLQDNKPVLERFGVDITELPLVSLAVIKPGTGGLDVFRYPRGRHVFEQACDAQRGHGGAPGAEDVTWGDDGGDSYQDGSQTDDVPEGGIDWGDGGGDGGGDEADTTQWSDGGGGNAGHPPSSSSGGGGSMATVVTSGRGATAITVRGGREPASSAPSPAPPEAPPPPSTAAPAKVDQAVSVARLESYLDAYAAGTLPQHLRSGRASQPGAARVDRSRDAVEVVSSVPHHFLSRLC